METESLVLESHKNLSCSISYIQGPLTGKGAPRQVTLFTIRPLLGTFHWCQQRAGFGGY